MRKIRACVKWRFFTHKPYTPAGHAFWSFHISCCINYTHEFMSTRWNTRGHSNLTVFGLIMETFGFKILHEMITNLVMVKGLLPLSQRPHFDRMTHPPKIRGCVIVWISYFWAYECLSHYASSLLEGSCSTYYLPQLLCNSFFWEDSNLVVCSNSLPFTGP